MATPWISGAVREGIIGGLVGATVVAAWLLIYHAAHWHATGGPPGRFGIRVLVRSTVFPAVIFAMIGILAAHVVVSRQRRHKGLLTTLIGALSLEVIALCALVWIARPTLGEAQWWPLFVANLLVAAGLVSYLFRPRGLGAEIVSDLWRGAAGEGITAGLAGASAVAVWFLVYDTLTAEPLRTPALLGAWLLHGLRDPKALVITGPLVLEYTVIHGLAFIAFGLATSGLLVLADREPRLFYLIVVLYCCFEVFALGVITILSESLLDAITWWPILVANGLAAMAMVMVFSRGHRPAWRDFMLAHW